MKQFSTNSKPVCILPADAGVHLDRDLAIPKWKSWSQLNKMKGQDATCTSLRLHAVVLEIVPLHVFTI